MRMRPHRADFVSSRHTLCVVLAAAGLSAAASGCTRPTSDRAPGAGAASSGAPSTAPAPVDGVERSATQSTLPAVPPATTATTEPASTSTPLTAYEYAKAGIKLNIPDWKKIDDKDYIVAVADQTSKFSLDVPELPAHLPGFLPLRLVVNGFIDDLKKKDQGLKVIDDADYKIPSASARRVRFGWTDEGVAKHGAAILIVHDDHVYILRLEGGAKQSEANDKLMDQVAQSVAWEKATK